MARPTGRKHATKEQDDRARELKLAYGTFRKAVHDYIMEYYAPGPGLERGETFTTLDVAEKMEVHRSHISGALNRWDDEDFDLKHENKTHIYIERKPKRPEPQPPWIAPKSSPHGLAEVPSYILQRNEDGNLVLWIDGSVYLARPITFEV